MEGASADGLSQGDPALVDGSMLLDSPTQMLDRVTVVESEDESECTTCNHFSITDVSVRCCCQPFPPLLSTYRGNSRALIE